MPELKAYIEQRRRIVDEMLERLLPNSRGKYEERIVSAMRYSLFAGGKRLRPILCIAGAEAVGGRAEEVLFVACALELIHTYSLIHDDLPAMDNDEMRRGRPTSHVVFGEAVAILAGDGLLTEAFRVLAAPENLEGRDPRNVLSVIHLIGEAAGYRGMVGGQTMDMLAQGMPVDLELVRYIHTHKTGELIRASVLSGAMLLGAGKEALEALEGYGRHLGLAFQIWDDVLDIEGDSHEMGKSTGSDERMNKATYPFVAGLDNSKEEARLLVERAIESLSLFGEEADPLREIARYVTERRK